MNEKRESAENGAAGVAATSFYLMVLSGPDRGRQTLLADGEIVLVGRGEICGVRLSDPSASRVHCRVTVSDGRAYLEDVGSRWGSLVNGAAVKSRQLVPGDRVTIGDCELELQLCESDAETAPVHNRVLADGADRRAAELESRRPARPKKARLRLGELVGERFGRYRIGAVLARGRAGIVFRAWEARRRRTVVLKVFWPDRFRDEREMQRFVRAVRATIPFEHEHLVKLCAAGRSGGYCFAASEYVPGESVTKIIDRVGVAGMLDWRKAWRIALGVARALDYAHARDVIHRNLRPSHVLVRKGDQHVKLGGLLLAKVLNEANGITRAGEVVGDLHYLAPEQLSGEPHVDQRADLYSLGALLYAILTGRPPFVGPVAELIAKALAEKPEPPTTYHLAIPAHFEGVVLRLLAKRPEDRFDSAGRVVGELERIGVYHNLAAEG